MVEILSSNTEVPFPYGGTGDVLCREFTEEKLECNEYVQQIQLLGDTK